MKTTIANGTFLDSFQVTESTGSEVDSSYKTILGELDHESGYSYEYRLTYVHDKLTDISARVFFTHDQSWNVDITNFTRYGKVPQKDTFTVSWLTTRSKDWEMRDYANLMLAAYDFTQELKSFIN